MILSRSRALPVALVLVGLVAVYISLTAWYAIGVAHAQGVDTAPVVERVLVQAAAPVVAEPPQPITPLLILALVATVFGAVSTILHFVAPRTANKWDDAASAKVDELLALLRLIPLPTPHAGTTVNVAAPVARTDELKRSADGKFGSGLALLLCIGLGFAVTQSACSGTVRQRIANGVGAFIDCEAPNIDAGLLAEAKAVTKAAVMKWISGSGHVDADGLKSEAAPLKSDLMRCAFEAAVAAVATPTPPQPGAAMAAWLEVDGAALRARFAQVKAELGWPAIRAVP